MSITDRNRIGPRRCSNANPTVRLAMTRPAVCRAFKGDRMFEGSDVVIVGAGFYGATVAEQLATKGRNVVIIDRRSHIGGNAYSEIDSTSGIEFHKYGAHLFHTPSQKVWEYINRFTSFTDYKHRVYTVHKGSVYPMPINLATICQFFGKFMSPSQAQKLIQQQRAGLLPEAAQSLEEKAISLIGKPLYDAFIRDYTFKQWQTNPQDLPSNIISRLPVRFNFDNRYFNDKYEGLPINGYTDIFEKMLKSAHIRTALNVDYFSVSKDIPKTARIIFTGPIDRYYNYEEGHLGWRTIDFEWERPLMSDFQGTSVMNYADRSDPWTRIIEFRHFHPERSYTSEMTLIAREFSRSANRSDEPYYPINTPQDRDIYARYRQRALGEERVRFGGRLGTYRYLDMHQAIGAALADIEDLTKWIDAK